MSETGSSVEEIRGIKQKDSRELLNQLTQTHNSKLADEIVKTVGYGNEEVRERLQELVEGDPRTHKFFVRSLKENIMENEKEVREAFDGFLLSHPETDESKARRAELENRVVRNSEVSTELAQGIRDLFPSGNYLVHGTSVEGALSVAGDSDSAIKSVAEIKKGDEKFKGKGGFLGISFSYNSVRALPGTWRHLTMFVTSPEKAMGEDQKLVVPYYAADRELQLVGNAYDRGLDAYIESTLSFYGLKDLLSGRGVIDDFAELERPFEYKAGETPIERDLNKLKTGELKLEDIENKYQVTDGKLSVVPDVTEQSISLGLIYSDFLLKHSPEGRELGRSIMEVTPQELLDLYNKTFYKGYELFSEVERAAGVLSDSMATSVDIENTLMFVPDGDINKWLDVFSRVKKAPKAFITFSSQEGPRVANWRLPEGDWQKAEKIINTNFRNVGVQEPNLPFSQVTGKEITEDDIVGVRIRHLNWDVIKQSQELVYRNGKLKLQSQQ